MRRTIAVIALSMLLALPALAAQPAYLDDRSSAASLIRSYYNAVNRHEYARAYSYYGTDGAPQDYRSFAEGYRHTAHVALRVGRVTSEGAAGSIYYSVPVAIDAIDDAGRHTQFNGCYTLRRIEPAIQEPPFRPLFIVSGKLAVAHGPLRTLVPQRCGP